MDYQFIADVHLGKLARLLRMPGFDTLYMSQLTTAGITAIALQQKRILLTRNENIKEEDALQTYILTHEDADTQLE